MTKIEVSIQASKFESVKGVLLELVDPGHDHIPVRGHGRQNGHTKVYRLFDQFRWYAHGERASAGE
jgi:nitrogen regulatory protein PII